MSLSSMRLFLGALERLTQSTVLRPCFVGNALIPNVMLFFLAFLPQFTDFDRGAPAMLMIAPGLDRAGPLYCCS